MQSNDLCTALSQTHRGRDLAIGGSVVSAALNQHARVPAHSDPNARKRERPIDHVGDNAALKGDRLPNSRPRVSIRMQAPSPARQRLPTLGPRQSDVSRLDAKAPLAPLSGPATARRVALLT
jgi:hypothetical protein